MSHAATHVSDASRLENRTRFSSGMALVWAIAVAKLVFHTYFNNRYGYFRDEFDYMSCGDHLAWGYVDQPPLIPFLIHISRAVLGDSLRAIRFILGWSLLWFLVFLFFPPSGVCFFFFFRIVQAAALARQLGGRRFALLL